MTDRKYGDYSRLLRMPELRMVDAEARFVTLAAPVNQVVRKPGMACFYYLRQGALRFFPDADASHWIDVEQGTAIGIEDGSHHCWTTTAAQAAAGEVWLMMGSVDRRHTIIQRLMNALIVVPADAEPHASIIRHCVEAMAIDARRTPGDDAIRRRFTEIIQLEMLRFAESSLAAVGPIPEAARHDAALLRAWTAFLNEPAFDWTLSKLAEAAGISRTVFAARFRAKLGDTPIAAIRQTRVRYAADMLRSSEAPVAEIALRAGYGSDIALMRAFRQVMGETPARWRKINSSRQ